MREEKLYPCKSTEAWVYWLQTSVLQFDYSIKHEPVCILLVSSTGDSFWCFHGQHERLRKMIELLVKWKNILISNSLEKNKQLYTSKESRSTVSQASQPRVSRGEVTLFLLPSVLWTVLRNFCMQCS